MPGFKKPPTLTQLTKERDTFNEKFPIGTKVILHKDDETKLETVIRSEAWIMGGHTVVAKVEGVAGGYMIDRIKKA